MVLNVKPKPLKLFGENIRESLCDLYVEKDFFVSTPKAFQTKESTQT